MKVIYWLISSQTEPSRMINDKEKLELMYLKKAYTQFQQLRSNDDAEHPREVA